MKDVLQPDPYKQAIEVLFANKRDKKMSFLFILTVQTSR